MYVDLEAPLLSLRHLVKQEGTHIFNRKSVLQPGGIGCPGCKGEIGGAICFKISVWSRVFEAKIQDIGYFDSDILEPR